MKTIQMTIDNDLLDRVDQATQALGIPRSAFIRQALELALRDLTITELERKHSEGYRKFPVRQGEFDVWDGEQAWGGQ
jgi:metal-responsive CopG/Arc/MetJ family transcriptional regulator